MAKESYQQFAFHRGELSPLLYGRQDSETYRGGLAKCRNWVPLVQGPITRRPGFVHNNFVKYPERKTRLIPFQYSVVQNYMLEFGHQYIRFYTQGGVLSDLARPITDVTLGTTTVLESPGHGYSAGDRIWLSGTGLQLYAPNIYNREVIVRNPSTNFFTIEDTGHNLIDTSMFDQPADPVQGGASRIFELPTDYLEADLEGLTWVQSADVLYLFHPQIRPRKLSRTAALTWKIEAVEFKDGPWGGINTTDTTLSLSGTGQTNITITASSSNGINGTAGFLPTDVGRLIRWMDPAAEWTWYRIDTVTSALVVEATRYGQAPSADTATKDWRLGLWSDTTGWPAAGTFYEDRLTLGGSPTTPMRVDFSRTGDYENFSPSDPDALVGDDHAVGVVLSAGQVNAVRWLVPDAKGLLVGTEGGEWLVSPSARNEALTPVNIAARRMSSYGTSKMQPVRVGTATLFAHRALRQLREMAYVFEIDGFRSPDMTVLSEHITHPGIAGDLVYQSRPAPVVWMARTDGALIGMTYDREQGVIGWHLHEMDGEVETLAVMPDPTSRYDEVWAVIKRGGERRIEFMSKLWEKGDIQEDAFHVDAGVAHIRTIPLAPYARRVAGLFHLTGLYVQAWADGGYAGEYQVQNGYLELDRPFTIATVGLPLRSTAETLPIEAGARDGSAQGKTKRVYRLGAWLADTLDLRYGSDLDHLNTLRFSEWGDLYNVPPSLFTGVVRERFEGDYDMLGQITLDVPTPAPATVVSLMPQVETEDDS